MPWGELNPPPMIGPEACPLESILVTSPGSVLLIALSVTHLLPWASIAIAKGFDRRPPVMILAALGSPRGYSVTLFPTWFAIQMFPRWSTANPWGALISPFVKPAEGDSGVLLSANFGHVCSAGEIRARKRR